jgi:hypothetical protein
MTRSVKKEAERAAVRELMTIIGLEPDNPPLEGEAPDFMISIAHRTIGVELTTYQSAMSVAGVGKRVVEAEWEELERSSQTIRIRNADLNSISLLFRFNSVVPPRRFHDQFLDEIQQFVRSKQQLLGSGYVDFWWHDFTSPLMSQYLQALVIKRCEGGGEWDSNITAGFVGNPGTTLARIVTEKSAKTYRPASELWLVIQDSQRPSEMVVPIQGTSEFNANPELQKSLNAGAFSRVFTFSAVGLLTWDRGSGQWNAAS